jgi:hypothetical protein
MRAAPHERAPGNFDLARLPGHTFAPVRALFGAISMRSTPFEVALDRHRSGLRPEVNWGPAACQYGPGRKLPQYAILRDLFLNSGQMPGGPPAPQFRKIKVRPKDLTVCSAAG